MNEQIDLTPEEDPNQLKMIIENDVLIIPDYDEADDR